MALQVRPGAHAPLSARDVTRLGYLLAAPLTHPSGAALVGACGARARSSAVHPPARHAHTNATLPRPSAARCAPRRRGTAPGPRALRRAVRGNAPAASAGWWCLNEHSCRQLEQARGTHSATAPSACDGCQPSLAAA